MYTFEYYVDKNNADRSVGDLITKFLNSLYLYNRIIYKENYAGRKYINVNFEIPGSPDPIDIFNAVLDLIKDKYEHEDILFSFEVIDTNTRRILHEYLHC